jgi:uncharacterized repeat protein (TIGR03943 family)
MRRYAQTALLFLLGGMMLKLALTGTYARYVGTAYLPLLVLTGLGLLAVAGVTLGRDIRWLGAPGDDDATTPMKLGGLFGTVVLSAPDRTGAAEPAAEPASDTLSTVDNRERAEAAGLAAAEHEGFTETADDATPAPTIADAPTALFETLPVARRALEDPPPVDPFAPGGLTAVRSAPAVVAGTRGGWALLVAALAVVVVAPPALGTEPATRLGTITAPAGAELPAVPAGDPAPLSLVDYAAHAAAGGHALAGRRVRLVGFVLAGPHGEPYLARLALGCCAAGARPVKVGLTGDLPGLLTPGRWVAVIGIYSALVDRDPINGAAIPYLSVVELTDLAPPTDPYER